MESCVFFFFFFELMSPYDIECSSKKNQCCGQVAVVAIHLFWQSTPLLLEYYHDNLGLLIV